jgi:hypothetical protein
MKHVPAVALRTVKHPLIFNPRHSRNLWIVWIIWTYWSYIRLWGCPHICCSLMDCKVIYCVVSSHQRTLGFQFRGHNQEYGIAIRAGYETLRLKRYVKGNVLHHWTTEQSSVAVELQHLSSVSHLGCPDWYDFLTENTGIVLQLYHERFYPDPTLIILEVQLVHHFIEGTGIDTIDTTILVLLMYTTADI